MGVLLFCVKRQECSDSVLVTEIDGREVLEEERQIPKRVETILLGGLHHAVNHCAGASAS